MYHVCVSIYRLIGAPLSFNLIGSPYQICCEWYIFFFSTTFKKTQKKLKWC